MYMLAFGRTLIYVVEIEIENENYSGSTANRLPATSCPTLDDWTNVVPMLTPNADVDR